MSSEDNGETPTEFDVEQYETDEDGYLTRGGILRAAMDRAAWAFHPTVLDGARKLYQDNDTRWEVWDIHGEFKGDDDPDVNAPEWIHAIETHEIPAGKYENGPDVAGVEYALPDIPEPEEEVEWVEVRRAILDHFDRDTLELAEAFATVPIQLMFDDMTDCPMMIGVGNPSSGKTTVADFFKDWDRVVYNHEITDKAFVTHQADQTPDELGEKDLLPKIKQQTLLVPEMGTWFSGEGVEAYMRTLAGVADGDGYVRSTGAQGTHGYEAEYPGEYQFGLIGCTTPPSPGAWSAMGNAGSRLLFHPMPNTDDRERVKKNIFDPSGLSYSEKKEKVRDKMTLWLQTVWHRYEGEIKWKQIESDEVQSALVMLAELIAKGRSVNYAKTTDDGDLEGESQPEDIHRATQMLRYTARAFAVMNGRDEVTVEDLQPCARITFASMPEKRRAIVRLLCNPDNGTSFTTTEVAQELGVSTNTARRRMQLAHLIGIGTYEKEGEKTRGGRTDVVRLDIDQQEYMWLFGAEKGYGKSASRGPLKWPFGEGSSE